MRPLVRILSVPDGGIAPAPVLTLADAKAHLRVVSSGEDVLISGLVDAAVQHLEGADLRGGIIGRALSRRKAVAAFERFPFSPSIELPLPPLETVHSVQWRDANGALQTVDPLSYTVTTEGLFGAVVLNWGRVWPQTLPHPRAVEITFTAGYATLPGPLRAALLLHVGHLYNNREATGDRATVLPLAYEALLAPFATHGWA